MAAAASNDAPLIGRPGRRRVDPPEGSYLGRLREQLGSGTTTLNVRDHMTLMFQKIQSLDEAADKALSSVDDLDDIVSRQTVINVELIRQYRALLAEKQALESRMVNTVDPVQAELLSRSIATVDKKLSLLDTRITNSVKRMETEQNESAKLFGINAPPAVFGSDVVGPFAWWTRATFALPNDAVTAKFFDVQGVPYTFPTKVVGQSSDDDFNVVSITVDSPAFCPVLCLSSENYDQIRMGMALRLPFEVIGRELTKGQQRLAKSMDTTIIPYFCAFMAGVIDDTGRVILPNAAVFLNTYADGDNVALYSFEVAFFPTPDLCNEFISLYNSTKINADVMLALRTNTVFADTFASGRQFFVERRSRILGPSLASCSVISLRYPSTATPNAVFSEQALVNTTTLRTAIAGFGVLAHDGKTQTPRQYWIPYAASTRPRDKPFAQTVGMATVDIPVLRALGSDGLVKQDLTEEDLHLYATRELIAVGALWNSASQVWQIPIICPDDLRKVYEPLVVRSVAMSSSEGGLWLSPDILTFWGADVPVTAGVFGMEWSGGTQTGMGAGRLVRPDTLYRYMLAVRQKYFPLNQSRVFKATDPDHIDWCFPSPESGNYGLLLTRGFSMRRLRQSDVLYTGDNLPLDAVVTPEVYRAMGFEGYCRPLADQLSSIFDTQRSISDLIGRRLNDASSKLHSAVARSRAVAAASGL